MDDGTVSGGTVSGGLAVWRWGSGVAGVPRGVDDHTVSDDLAVALGRGWVCRVAWTTT
ncbi:hypothetical protein [Lentzea aerocolonigenes]|uniref:hypothetical protein n=1 Tax=Lentzea aerocolonigenes TaxID=68170 RepID=UPI000B28256C|nr:hypothetical protein [Lentzea aerocolonigenes]